MEFRLQDLIRLWQLPVMLASLYSDRERAIKRCNIRRFPINTGTHTETDIPLTFYTHLLTSLTSMTLPNVPSPRVETTSSERVKVQQLQSNISYQITTKFNIQHHPPLLLIFGCSILRKLTAKRFYSIRILLVLSLVQLLDIE